MMKDKIQQLIQWAEVREKAFSACHKVFQTESAKFKSLGRLEENAFWKQHLTLLLNEQPEAITEDAHFRKHDVDGRAESESVTHTESSCASSSETAAVDGHEQTKKFCELTGKFY